MPENDPISGSGGGGEGAAASRKSIACEFCDSRLTATGDGLKKSERMKALLKAEDELVTANATIATQKQEIENLTAKLAARPEPAPAPASRPKAALLGL